MKDFICRRLKVVFTSIFLVLVFILGVGINAQAQTCNCKEYIYLDEPAIGAVLKFEVDPNMLPLIETFGTNGGAPPAEHWYPGTGTSILPGPHGVAADLNGNIIIGASGGGPFYRLNCDGGLDPAQTPINAYGGVNSIFSVGNTIYSNGNGARAINSCTGALLGTAQYRNNNGVVNDLDWHWGLAHNKVTGMVYATGRKENSKSVWAATITQFNASIAGTLILDPLIGQGTNPTVNPGEKLFPAIDSEINGVVGDNLGNIYVVLGDAILKYDATGGFVASVSNPAKLSSPIGITWSETSNRLYVSNYTDDPAQDCIGVIDPVTMTYLGTGAPNPNVSLNNTAKAIGILKECCPAGLPPSSTKNVCGGIGSKFYLNEEMFDLCDGIVCGSSWAPQGTPTGMTFDACDNSVTITGNGCGTFNLSVGAVSSTGCGAQSATFTICNTLPPAVTAVASACNLATNQYSLSGQVSFVNVPATTGTMTVSVSGGGSQMFTAPFVSPIAYSITGLSSDGASRTVTVSFSDATLCTSMVTYNAPAACVASCDCKEYVYLDEPAIGAVLKFEVDPSMLPLIETFGTNGGAPPAEHWYPGTGTSILPAPHGVAADLNGNIIIGASGGGPFYRLNCDGGLDPAQTPINAYGGVNNIFSVGNTIYSNGNGARAINSCTGDLLGTAQYRNNDGIVNDLDWHWGLAHNKATGMVYATGRKGNSKSVWAATIAQFNASVAGTLILDPLIGQGTNPTVNPGEKLFPALNSEINGVVGDNSGNIYVVLGDAILKYDATGGYVTSVSNPAKLNSPIGITWSETSNRLYVSNYTDDPAQDCIGVIDPVTMTYLGTGAPNPNLSLNNTAKAIGILKECCPAGLPPSSTKNVCGGVGSKFYLNEEMFDLCDGIVCGSSWTPQGTPTGMTFDACDNSVTITGDGCGTFNLSVGAVSSTGCGAQSATFTICTALPPAITANITNCNVGTNQYELTGTVTFTTPPATGTMTVSVSGGGNQVFNAPFNSPIAYSISGLTLSGANRIVTVVFSDAPTCSATTSYTEPMSCPCQSITNPSGTQAFCQGNSGANITVETSQNTTNGIRFVRFTSDQTANNASPTAGELAAIYAGTALATVTATGGTAPYTATLTTAAAGWNAIAPGTYYVYAIVNPDPGAACRRTQEIVVTVTAAPTAGITQTAPTCTGATPNNNGIISISSANNTTHFGISTVGALTYDGPGFPATTFNGAPQDIVSSIPNTGGSYIVRLFNGTANCFTDQAVTVNPVTCVVSCIPPSLSTVAATVCYGSSVHLSTLITNNSPVGTISFHATAADATAGANPLLNSVVTPLSNTTFYVRSAISATCFSTAAIQVSVSNPPALSVHNAQICTNSSVNLATLVDDSGGGSLTYFTSVANAQSNINPLPSGVVSPLAATNYYIRSTTANGCFTVKEVTISFIAPTCNTIQISGPN